MNVSSDAIPYGAPAGQPALQATRTAPSTAAFVLVLVGIVLCSFKWTVGSSIPVCDGFFFVAILVLALRMLQGFVRLGGLPMFMIFGCLLFMVSALICASLADSATTDSVIALKMLFALGPFPLLLALVIQDDQRRLDALLAAWLAGAACTAMVAVTTRYGIWFFGLIDDTRGGRFAGMTYHPNALGYQCALTAPIALYFILSKHTRMYRWLALGALPAVLLGLQLSGSRASLLALLLGIALPYLLALQWRRTPLLALLVLGLLAAFALTGAILSELELPIAGTFEESAAGRLMNLSSSSAGSDSGRMALARYAWQHFLQNPLFGEGYHWLRSAHVQVLAILQSGGLLGMSAFFTWSLGILLAWLRVETAVRTSAAVPRALWAAVVAGLVIWFVNGALQPLLIDQNGYIMVGVLIALDARIRMRAWNSFGRLAAERYARP